MNELFGCPRVRGVDKRSAVNQPFRNADRGDLMWRARSGGSEGVGKATTASVVASILLVIIADALFTALFYVYT